ncbi:MAG: ribose-5-phosphate isomerase RpiA, partial [Pseudomonadota bacterium]
RAAARAALEEVQGGMRLGLGTGSTAAWFVDLLGERAKREKLDLSCVPTSVRTARQAEKAGLRVTTLDEAGWLDLTVDGADEFDGDLALIKGGGGALLQEKIVATASDRMVVIADASKQVDALGAFPLPVEIVTFGWETTKAIVEDALEDLEVDGRLTTLRLNGDEPFLTDCGNFIIDLHLKRIGDAEEVAGTLVNIAGVVETGLFVDVADAVIIGHGDETTDMLSLDEDGAGA